jgi:hypothetical protein
LNRSNFPIQLDEKQVPAREGPSKVISVPLASTVLATKPTYAI